jgi:uncharacterized protein YkwD
MLLCTYPITQSNRVIQVNFFTTNKLHTDMKNKLFSLSILTFCTIQMCFAQRSDFALVEHSRNISGLDASFAKLQDNSVIYNNSLVFEPIPTPLNQTLVTDFIEIEGQRYELPQAGDNGNCGGLLFNYARFDQLPVFPREHYTPSTEQYEQSMRQTEAYSQPSQQNYQYSTQSTSSETYTQPTEHYVEYTPQQHLTQGGYTNQSGEQVTYSQQPVTYSNESTTAQQSVQYTESDRSEFYTPTQSTSQYTQPTYTQPTTPSYSNIAVADAGSAFNNEMLTAVNAQRAKGCNCGGEYMAPVLPIQWDAALERAAIRQVQDMDKNNNFSHFGTDNSSPDDRAKDAGFNKTENFGENIGMGYISISHAMEGWLNSPGHCKGIMSPETLYIGAAKSGKMWCQAFGKK